MNDFEISEGVLYKYRGNGGNVIIPDGVTEIAMSAFAGCASLSSVTIPDTVAEIGMFAFSDCDEALVIYGKSGSCAEAYALEEGIELKCI